MVKSAHLTGSVSRKAGGLFDAVSRLAQSQEKQGMAVRAFGLWDEFADADLAVWNPVPVAAFKPSWPKLIGRAPGFLDELNEFAPDISHTHGLWLYSSIAAKNYSRAKKRPYFISPHGMLDPWALKNSRWKKWIAYQMFEREHLHGARCFRALCVSEAHSIRRVQLKNDIAVIPNGIDLPTGPAPSAPSWKQNFGSEKKVLLFLGRIHPKKGIVNLLRAWSHVQGAGSGGQEWVLAIAGWDQGGHERELKQLATELGLAWMDTRSQLPTPNSQLQPPCSVLFIGPQFNAAKAECYHHCDAFVLPSLSEGLPMVVLEAWAHSKPVVMTPECNLPEGFRAGAAIKVEASETGLISGFNALQRMTDSERFKMGLSGRGLVEDRFAWPRVGQQLQAVQEWILGGGTKPDCILES